MNHTAALLLGVLLVAVGGCTGSSGEATTGTTTGTTVDSSLRQRLPAEIRHSGVLRIATDASYAPAGFFAPDGRTVIGFEPDMADAVGGLLGVRVKLVVTDFVDALDAVREDRVDLAMSAITDTAEREKKVDFVNYFTAGSAILVQRGNRHGITEIEDLCGHVVAVERGTVQVDLLRRTQGLCDGKPIKVQRHRTNADALVRLRTGRATAVLNDYPMAAHLTTDPRTQADYQLASTAQYEPGLYGIAVAKDEGRLREALQATLERVVSTGEYHRILKAWGVADGAVGAVTVNAG